MATEIGALSHLVEAATALANLDSTTGKPTGETVAPVPPGQPTAKPAKVAEKKAVSPQKKAAANAATAEVGPRTNKREIFPQRLLAVLNDASLSDIISWLPHGRSFVIIRPDVFTEKVMPTYFPPVDARGSTKYPSFTRKLNRWGFRQATRGPDTGAFHHPLFRRDQPELCVDMVCQRSRSTPGGKQNKKQLKSEAAAAAAVKVAPLTKESIDKILPSTHTAFEKTTATVSLDETRSDTSNNSNQSRATSTNSIPSVIKQGISTDKAFVDMTIRQRDEMERMRVAQAMLYRAFTSALQDQAK